MPLTGRNQLEKIKESIDVFSLSSPGAWTDDFAVYGGRLARLGMDIARTTCVDLPIPKIHLRPFNESIDWHLKQRTTNNFISSLYVRA